MSARRIPSSNKGKRRESVEGATRWEINRDRHPETRRRGWRKGILEQWQRYPHWNTTRKHKKRRRDQNGNNRRYQRRDMKKGLLSGRNESMGIIMEENQLGSRDHGTL